MNLPLIIGVCTLLAALVPFLIARRQGSGRIATSDAAVLWAEGKAMREEYRARISELNGIVARCEQRISDLERRNDKLDKENNNLHNVIGKLEKELRQRAGV